MLKHIIFDFDGTLANSSEMGLQIINEFSDKYNLKKFTKEEILILNSVPIKDRFKLVGIPLYKIPQILIDGLLRYRQLVGLVTIFDGIDNLIHSLKSQEYKISIISSNSTDNIHYFLEKYNLDIFDNIISSKNLFGKHKSIMYYLKKYKLEKDQVIYVGDELRDIEACKKVGIKIISVNWGYDSLDLIKSAKPDYIAYKPQDIFDIVNSKELNN